MSKHLAIIVVLFCRAVLAVYTPHEKSHPSENDRPTIVVKWKGTASELRIHHLINVQLLMSHRTLIIQQVPLSRNDTMRTIAKRCFDMECHKWRTFRYSKSKPAFLRHKRTRDDGRSGITEPIQWKLDERLPDKIFNSLTEFGVHVVEQAIVTIMMTRPKSESVAYRDFIDISPVAKISDLAERAVAQLPNAYFNVVSQFPISKRMTNMR